MTWMDAGACKVHLDMHCPDWDAEILSRLDAREIVTRVAKAGADALYFFAKDCYGNAYYSTSVGRRHPNMGNRDFLREVCDEAQHHRLPIVAYYSVIWDNGAAEAHPEWTLRDPSGRALSDTVTSELGKWQYLCHNSPYGDYAESMLREIAAAYPVSGFHLDMFNMDFGGLSCHCQYCQRAFAERTGRPLPVSASWDDLWREFLNFRYDSVEALMRKLREAAQSQDADMPVVMNYHAAPNFDWRVGQLPVRHSQPSSLGTGETYTPMFGDCYPGMEGRFIRNLLPGRSFEMVSWRMTRITDFTLKSRTQLRWELGTGLLHGGSVMLIDQPFADGSLDPVAYDRIGQVFHEMKAAQQFLVGQFVPHVAVYYSAQTRDWYGREDQERFIVPVTGFYKALVESHFQVDFVFDETANLRLLNEFAAIVLPNVAVLSDHECDAIRQYVHQGGVLIATLDSSRFDRNGEPLGDFALRDVFGASFQRKLDCDNAYFRNIPPPFESAIDPRQFVLCPGPILMINPTTATTYGDLHTAFHKRLVPQQFFSHNIHPPHDRIGPALCVNRFGKGTCVYLPFGLDRAYGDFYELAEHRQLIEAIVRAFAPPPLVDISAPLNCEATLRYDADCLYVHLTMFNALRQNVALPTLNRPIRPSLRMEEPASYTATLRPEAPFTAASVVHGDADLDHDETTVTVRCQDVYVVIAITFGGKS